MLGIVDAFQIEKPKEFGFFFWVGGRGGRAKCTKVGVGGQNV